MFPRCPLSFAACSSPRNRPSIPACVVAQQLFASGWSMKVKLTTGIPLIVCGLGIGWLAYQNLMWAVWGKQNSWHEYVGFWGCPIMLVSGFTALKSVRAGSYLG